MKLIAGDMPIKDLTPKTTNLGDRIVKNMRICGSGIYTYAMREAPLLHLDPVPEKYRNLDVINVFRPPEVLKANKEKFARVPIITGHHVLVDTQNAKQLVVGMVGDSINEEVDEKDGELYLYTTGTIVAGDGIEAYENYGQLSVGYDPVIEWQEGEHKGIPYQAVLKGFNDINHLLICKTARGGSQCCVMDSLDGSSPLERILSQAGGKKVFFTKIFGSKKQAVVGDEALVSTLLQSIAVGADPAVQVPKIKKIVGDSNQEFTGYLDELVEAKGEALDVMAKAVNIVEDFYKTNMLGDEAKGNDDATKDPEGADKKPAGDEGKKPDEGKKEPEDKKPAGDEAKCPDCGKAKGECHCGDKKPSAGDAIDYDLIAQKTAAIIMAAGKLAGDESHQAVQGTVVLGDNAPTNTNSKTSDELMKEIM